MSVKIKGNLEIGRDGIAQGNILGSSINGNDFSSTGTLVIDTYLQEDFDKIISVLPLSHYGSFTTNPGNSFSSNGFNLFILEKMPVIISGSAFVMDTYNVNLSTIIENPANSTLYVYVQMIQGLAKYLISSEVIAEAGTSAYNILWIGTLKTNSNSITNINILSRSRLDVFGLSSTAAGSSIPVSSGLPSGTGTITW